MPTVRLVLGSDSDHSNCDGTYLTFSMFEILLFFKRLVLMLSEKGMQLNTFYVVHAKTIDKSHIIIVIRLLYVILLQKNNPERHFDLKRP